MWDDDAIPPEERVLRRVRRIPDCVIFDLLTGEPEIKAGALKFDDDGMSVHRDSCRAALGVPRSEICDWDTHHAIEFAVATVRRGQGGVVHEDDPGDTVLGKAHALVRTRSPRPSKSEKTAIRDQIIDNHVWVAEDPNCPTRAAD